MSDKKHRKAHVDSTSELVKTAQAALTPIEIPNHLDIDKFDMPYFDQIIAESPNIFWSEHKITLAVFLARNCSDLDYQKKLLRQEGYVITNPETGTKYKNPRVDVVTKLEATIIASRRGLGLHARAQAGDNREHAKRNAIALAAQKAIKNGSVAELIPR